MKRISVFRSLVPLLFCALSASANSISYSVTNLGSFGGSGDTVYGFMSSFATGINDSGEVTGFSYLPNATPQAFLYSNGVMNDLGSGAGEGINNAGQVTGYVNLPNGSYRAFLYSNGVMNDLGTLGGANSVGFAINDSGRVTGYANVSNQSSGAFLYSNGVISDIGGGIGYGLSNTGQITGDAGYPASDAFLYDNGAMTDLGALGSSGSVGYGINSSGQVTGFSYVSQLSAHAFLYSNGVMSDLGTLGGLSSRGFGINASGQVVGWSSLPNSNQVAFLYSNGAMIDLNSLIDPTLGVTLFDAQGINDLGQIVANATNGDAYLLTLISSSPEPSTLALLGAGFMLLAITRRVAGPYIERSTQKFD